MAWTAPNEYAVSPVADPTAPVQQPARRASTLAEVFGVSRMLARVIPLFPEEQRAPQFDHAAAGHALPPPAETVSGAFLARCVVLQAIGAAFIAALWIAGLANKPFEGDNGFLCWAIVAMAALGIVCVFLRRWNDVQWIATHVVRIGLLGTVVGLIIAFSAAASGDAADPSAIKPLIGAVVSGMYVSLYATLLGIATNLWLKINLRVLGGDSR